ncbi:MAG: hypothetical protein FWD23_05365 [Oscillospiraceae bacterium]|nr:hypothetical protein [Oscillospiraceae bacterium]
MNDAKEMKENEKSSKNGGAARIIEIFVLISSAVFLSVAASVLFVGVAGTLCAVVASALFSCALFLSGGALLCFGAAAVSSAASFLITYLICGNLINALAGMVYVAAGAFIYLGVKRKHPRTRITVGLTCFLVVFHFSLIVLYFLLKTGTFSIDMVSLLAEDVLTSGVQLAVGPVLSTIPEADKTAYIQEFVKNMKAVTPALFVLYSAAFAYLSSSFFKSFYNIFIPMANPGRKKIKNKYWRLDISFVSAAAALCAIIASLFVPSQKYPLPSVILTNLIYILIPGFCIVGVYFVHDKVSKEKAGIFLVVFALCAIIAVLLLPAALFAFVLVFMLSGLYATLVEDMKKFFKKAKKALLGDEDENDDDDDYID